MQIESERFVWRILRLTIPQYQSRHRPHLAQARPLQRICLSEYKRVFVGAVDDEVSK